MKRTRLERKTGIKRKAPAKARKAGKKPVDGAGKQISRPRKGQTKTCPNCNEEFYLSPARALKQTYCSVPCANQARVDPASRVTVTCKSCGKDYEAYKSYLELRGTSYCSRKCLDKHRRAKNPRLKTKYCDTLFSKIIRERDGVCVRCGTTERLQCSHIVTRGISITRCDEDNAITLCYRCHLGWWHKNPVEAGRWFDERWPGRYDELRVKSQSKEKVDWAEVYKALQKRWKEMTA